MDDRDIKPENIVEPQAPPRRTDGPAIWPMVIADMQSRDAAGRAKYGTPLQANNGRDALVDAYQEALDLAVYLRQAIAERNSLAVVPRPAFDAEHEEAATPRKQVPHVTSQSVLDAGINVFGLQLVLESLGDGALTFDLTHRGRLWRVTFDGTIGDAAGEESQP
jgi:hypothetical protein